MKSRYDIDALLRRLGPIRSERDPALVRMKSRDFYWYSPVLKRQLEYVTGDVLVIPASKAELLAALAACHDLDIPVTPRGTGTGNYGQAMPLAGGVVLDLSALAKVTDIGAGRLTAEPGIVMAEADAAARSRSNQELRIHPSTVRTASLGGFIAGGSGGIGSIRWGGLRDWGNILSLEVATMEAKPRLMQITGADIHKVAHAYGTNGIISSVSVPLAPAYRWHDVFIGCDTLRAAADLANAIGEQDGLLLKNLAMVAAPAPYEYFTRHRRFLPRHQHLVMVMVAEHAVAPLIAFVGRRKGAEVLFRTDTLAADEAHGLPPGYELAWNHTTLRALRIDPKITYLQVLYPFPGQVDLVDRIHAKLGEEATAHLEFVRFDGKVTCFGLPLVRFTTEERLAELMKMHEDMGAPIFNAHCTTLEEGGMKATDEVQLAFKREADPKGLLNPGKMIAWDDPGYDYKSGRTYLFRGLA